MDCLRFHPKEYVRLREPPSRVFISSTVKDLSSFRQGVKSALEEYNKGRIVCDLSEDWANGFEIVTTRVQAVLKQSHAYYGIFAHYHGWTPRDETVSITQLEFDWARALWGEDRPPFIAVFVPEIASEADRALTKAAKKILRQQYPAAPGRQKELLELQRKFRAYVEGLGHTITRFASEGQLAVRAIIIYRDWSNELVRAARSSDPVQASSREPTEIELGRLGRSAQVARFKEILAEANLDGRSHVAILVKGDEGMGHSRFARSLLADELAKASVVHGRPAAPGFSAELLAVWMLRELKRPPVGGALWALSNALCGILRERPLCVVITRIGDYQGGTVGFRDTFWAPLLTLLAAAAPAPRHALVVLLLDPSSIATANSKFEGDGSGFPEITLSRFTRLQVMQWLARHEVPDDPPGRRKEIVDDVLSTAQSEPSPETVFGRLTRVGLWP